MEKRLKKTGITKAMLWKDYIKTHPDGYMSSQFCEYYNRWIKRASPVMHINHKASDKMYVDYAGKTLELVDKDTGEIIVLLQFPKPLARALAFLQLKRIFVLLYFPNLFWTQLFSSFSPGIWGVNTRGMRS